MSAVDSPGSSSGAILLEESGAIPVPASLLGSIASTSSQARDQEEDLLVARCLEGEVEAFRPLVQR